jgi:hypothetical protein
MCPRAGVAKHVAGADCIVDVLKRPLPMETDPGLRAVVEALRSHLSNAEAAFGLSHAVWMVFLCKLGANANLPPGLRPPVPASMMELWRMVEEADGVEPLVRAYRDGGNNTSHLWALVGMQTAIRWCPGACGRAASSR